MAHHNRFIPDGQRIKALRTQQGLTVCEVAGTTNLSGAHLYRMEATKRPNAAAGTVARVALALGTSVEYLLGLTDDQRSIEEVFD